MRVLGLLLVGLLISTPPVLAQAQAEAGIRHVLNGLLEAVGNADMPGFIAFFDDDATMFHSMAQPPQRLQGPTEIERSMRPVFDQIKASSGRTTGTYIQLQPLDLRIQPFDQFAVVSFQLGSGPVIQRRTLVFRQDASVWRVVHIHASQLQTGTPD